MKVKAVFVFALALIMALVAVGPAAARPVTEDEPPPLIGLPDVEILPFDDSIVLKFAARFDGGNFDEWDSVTEIDPGTADIYLRGFGCPNNWGHDIRFYRFCAKMVVNGNYNGKAFLSDYTPANTDYAIWRWSAKIITTAGPEHVTNVFSAWATGNGAVVVKLRAWHMDVSGIPFTVLQLGCWNSYSGDYTWLPGQLMPNSYGNTGLGQVTIVWRGGGGLSGACELDLLNLETLVKNRELIFFDAGGYLIGGSQVGVIVPQNANNTHYVDDFTYWGPSLGGGG